MFGLFLFFFPLAGREYAARELRPRNLSHNNYYFQATARCLSIKPVEQLAMFYNSCENCCLTSPDYSSDTSKNKLVNSVGFQGPSQFVGEELACWKGEFLTEMGSEVAQVGEEMIQQKCCLVSMRGQLVFLGWDSKGDSMSASDKPKKILVRLVQGRKKNTTFLSLEINLENIS